MIHPTALISPNAKIAENVDIGAYCVVEDAVEIGADCVLDHHIVVKANTKMGRNNRLYSGVILGGDPQDLQSGTEQTQLIIGDNNIFREYVTVNRGSHKQDKITRISSNNFLMTGAHVGHDCTIGNHVILTNGAALAGHVVVDDRAIIGAYCTVHQFCNVGAYSMMSRGAMINKDVLPYLMVAENKPKVFGLNKIGLTRNGFSAADIKILMQAYKIIFTSELIIEQVITELQTLAEQCAAVQLFIAGLLRAKRGIVR